MASKWLLLKRFSGIWSVIYRNRIRVRSHVRALYSGSGLLGVSSVLWTLWVRRMSAPSPGLCDLGRMSALSSLRFRVETC